MHDLRDVGGTPGGLGVFVLGLGLIIAGGYLLLQQVDVHGGYWSWGMRGGGRGFGISLLPLLLGIILLFVNGSSMIGKVLTYGGALVILVGIIANLDIHFRTTSLFNTLVMLVMLVSGVGLVLRSARPMGGQRAPERD
ncbi:MAG: hypothetical protein R3B48_11050 [Kofleriaceae bacterium]